MPADAVVEPDHTADADDEARASVGVGQHDDEADDEADETPEASRGDSTSANSSSSCCASCCCNEIDLRFMRFDVDRCSDDDHASAPPAAPAVAAAAAAASNDCDDAGTAGAGGDTASVAARSGSDGDADCCCAAAKLLTALVRVFGTRLLPFELLREARGLINELGCASVDEPLPNECECGSGLFSLLAGARRSPPVHIRRTKHRRSHREHRAESSR